MTPTTVIRRGRPGTGTVAATTSIPAPGNPPGGPTSPVDLSRYENTITLATASIPAGRPDPGQVVGSSGGAGSAPSAAGPAGRGGSDTAREAGPTAPEVAPLIGYLPATGDASASRPAIRPMSLAANTGPSTPGSKQPEVAISPPARERSAVPGNFAGAVEEDPGTDPMDWSPIDDDPDVVIPDYDFTGVAPLGDLVTPSIDSTSADDGSDSGSGSYSSASGDSPAAQMSYSSSSGQSSSSGSPSPPYSSSNVPPLALSGGTSLQGSAPTYTNSGVPVGTIFTVTLVNPNNGFSIDTSSIKWQGGTDIRGYVGGSYLDAAPNALSVSRGVQTNGNLTYSFVVDARARSYTIKVDAKYIGATKTPPTTTVTFSSVRPKTARLSPGPQLGQPRFSAANGSLTAALVTATSPFKGMVIRANTATDRFGGSFMFLQTANVRRTKVDGGRTTRMGNIGTGANLDNSYPGQSGAIGYPVDTLSPNSRTPNGWNRAANAVQDDHYMNDSPIVPAPLASTTRLTVGAGAASPESFTTYLMYRPDNNGVWVALAKLNWGWGIDLTNPPPAKVGTPVFVYDPSGTTVNDEWPSWTGTTTQILSGGWR